MIELDGIKFYPTKQGYYLGHQNGRSIRMHRYVWEKHNGPIPEGFHIHHRDGDKANNTIDNLILIPKEFHLSYHGEKKASSEVAKANMEERVRPAEVEWHKSEAAKDFHREHYEQYTREIWLQPITKVCQYCGKEYQTVHAKGTTSKYCSIDCKNKAKNLREHPRITKKCHTCGKEFETGDNRHRFCSDACRISWFRHHHKSDHPSQ